MLALHTKDCRGIWNLWGLTRKDMEQKKGQGVQRSHHPQVVLIPPKADRVWKPQGPWQTPVGTPNILFPPELRRHTRDRRVLLSLLGYLNVDMVRVGPDLLVGHLAGSGSVGCPREDREEAAQGPLDRSRDTPGCSRRLLPPPLHTRVHTASQHCQDDRCICRAPMVIHCQVVE